MFLTRGNRRAQERSEGLPRLVFVSLAAVFVFGTDFVVATPLGRGTVVEHPRPQVGAPVGVVGFLAVAQVAPASFAVPKKAAPLAELYVESAHPVDGGLEVLGTCWERHMFQGEVVALHEACQDPTDRESCWVTRREDELPKRSIVSECHRGRPAPRSRESGCGIVSVSAQVTNSKFQFGDQFGRASQSAPKFATKLNVATHVNVVRTLSCSIHPNFGLGWYAARCLTVQ